MKPRCARLRRNCSSPGRVRPCRAMRPQWSRLRLSRSRSRNAVGWKWPCSKRMAIARKRRGCWASAAAPCGAACGSWASRAEASAELSAKVGVEVSVTAGGAAVRFGPLAARMEKAHRVVRLQQSSAVGLLQQILNAVTLFQQFLQREIHAFTREGIDLEVAHELVFAIRGNDREAI